MAWFKVSDGLFSDPKVLAAGEAAMGLWVRAGSYCMAQLTDGFVSREALDMLLPGRKKGARLALARTLVGSGLWSESDSGWSFIGWLTYQPSRAAVLAKRKANQENGRSGGVASAHARAQANRLDSASTS